ncbi:MAG TPA: hypothetical protein VFF69_15125 [Phycisphaerales bacterium]|nr:hypothetical protein [Phycisphaerales bacterium]
MSKLPLAVGLALLHAAMLARAQSQPGPDQVTEAVQPAAQAQSSLAGPQVATEEARTLVVYEYGGGLQDLGLPPPEAALELLALDERARERVAHVLAERAMLAERLIIDNFELFSQGETVEASESKLGKALFFVQVLRVLEPLIERGPLEDEIRAQLPADQAAAFDRLLDEYWEAVGKARVEEARAKGEKIGLRRAVREARRDQLGKEIELAAARAIESERFAVDYLTRGLDLTPEQQARIDRLVRDFGARTMGAPDEKAKEGLFAAVLAFLDERQRDLLLERIKGL